MHIHEAILFLRYIWSTGIQVALREKTFGVSFNRFDDDISKKKWYVPCTPVTLRDVDRNTPSPSVSSNQELRVHMTSREINNAFLSQDYNKISCITSEGNLVTRSFPVEWVQADLDFPCSKTNQNITIQGAFSVIEFHTILNHIEKCSYIWLGWWFETKLTYNQWTNPTQEYARTNYFGRRRLQKMPQYLMYWLVWFICQSFRKLKFKTYT